MIIKLYISGVSDKKLLIQELSKYSKIRIFKSIILFETNEPVFTLTHHKCISIIEIWDTFFELKTIDIKDAHFDISVKYFDDTPVLKYSTILDCLFDSVNNVAHRRRINCRNSPIFYAMCINQLGKAKIQLKSL
jgi:hypothetical protein